MPAQAPATIHVEIDGLDPEERSDMTIEDLISAGWRRHDTQADAVAQELAEAHAQVAPAAQLNAYVRLLTHLYAEHLADPAAGVRHLAPLRARFEHEAPAPYRPASTAIATLEFVAGNAHALDGLAREERASALATAASALAARGDLAAGQRALSSALDLAEHGIADGSPTLRALAAAANNLAVELERHAPRGPADDAAMIRFADAALDWWRRAGGWIEQERAHYRCARSRLAAGRAADAIACANDGLRLCAANDAPAFERFFMQAVRAMACRADGRAVDFERDRASPLAAYDTLTPEERGQCARQLAELEADERRQPGAIIDSHVA